MKTQQIVILGGGVGGTVVANVLARKSTRQAAQITLIDGSGQHAYQPGWLYIPFGGAPPERLERKERSLLARRVRLVVGMAARIDRQAREVIMQNGDAYPYDTLVVATGARIVREELPGYAEGAHHFYSSEAALRLHAALRAFKGGRILIGVADIPYKCPPAPLEFACLLDDYLRERGLREQTRLVYLSPINRVFTIESVSDSVTPLLDERGIDYELFSTPRRSIPRRERSRPSKATP